MGTLNVGATNTTFGTRLFVRIIIAKWKRLSGAPSSGDVPISG